MSVKANPLANLSVPMASCIVHLRNGMQIRVDKSTQAWTYKCGHFGADVGLNALRFPVAYQTFAKLLNRRLLKKVATHKNRHFYGLREEYK